MPTNSSPRLHVVEAPYIDAFFECSYSGDEAFVRRLIIEYSIVVFQER
jgi:hypothetical protein